MFQDSRLLPWRRVIDNVALGLPRERPCGRGRRAGPGRPGRPAAPTGRRASRAGSASALSLARALVHARACLLLGEPLGALDALTRIEMHQLIEGLWQRKRLYRACWSRTTCRRPWRWPTA